MKKLIINESQAYLLELKKISPTEYIISAGDELFHGTSEPFNIKNLGVGGYDNILWTSPDSSLIAQTYISVGNKVQFDSSDLTKPVYSKDLRKVQQLIGIDYDYNQVEFDKYRPISFMQAPAFEKMHDLTSKYMDEYEKARSEYRSFEDKTRDLTDEQIDSMSDEQIDKMYDHLLDLEEISKKAKEKVYKYDYSKSKIDYVNKKLYNLGYEPEDKMSSNDHGWVLLIQNDKILPPNTRAEGRLLILKPKRDLKIYDLRKKEESDLTDLEYHNISGFRSIEKAGYDGILINDFAQSSNYGNTGHISVGLFKHTISDLGISEIPATHQDLNMDSTHSQEYKKFKQQ